MLLLHQHHLVEFYLTMVKTALEIFQVITCSLVVMYNVTCKAYQIIDAEYYGLPCGL